MKKFYSQNRAGFTLVEILVVIAIVAVLVAITFGLAGPVQNMVRETSCKSQMDKIKLALNDFKSTYGEFPMPNGSGSQDTWEKLLIESLRGDKILVRRNSKIELVNYNSGRAGAEKRAFIALSDFMFNEENPESATQILDPWDNPFQYRYNNIAGGRLGKAWNSPTFLLISAGAKFNEPLTTEDFFTGTMEKDGLPALDVNSSDYYFNDIRKDNLTNF